MKYTFTFKNNDILEMKAIKHSAFASEETYCYEAKLYLNGKPFAEVSNDGYGGCDDVYPLGKTTYEDVQNLDKKCKEEMPKVDSQFDDEGLTQDLELWCSEQVTNMLRFRDLKRLMNKKVLYLNEENVLMGIAWKNSKKVTDRHIDFFTNRHPNYKILNTMPEEEALEIYANA